MEHLFHTWIVFILLVEILNNKGKYRALVVVGKGKNF